MSAAEKEAKETADETKKAVEQEVEEGKKGADEAGKKAVPKKPGSSG